MARCTSAREIAVYLRSTPRRENRRGPHESAMPPKPAPLALLTLPREKYSSATTVRTTTFEDRWLPSTQRPEKRHGGSGRFQEIRRTDWNRRRWNGPEKPGPANSGGGSAAEMSGTRLRTIP